MLRLSEDVYILSIAVEEARKVIPVKIKTYAVNIIEQLRKTVYVDAASCNEAEDIVREKYSNGEYGEPTLNQHCISTIINVIGPKSH